MAAERSEDPVLVGYLEQAEKTLAQAERTLSVKEREEFLRIATQWLLLAEERIKKSS